MQLLNKQKIYNERIELGMKENKIEFFSFTLPISKKGMVNGC